MRIINNITVWTRWRTRSCSGVWLLCCTGLCGATQRGQDEAAPWVWRDCSDDRCYLSSWSWFLVLVLVSSPCSLLVLVLVLVLTLVLSRPSLPVPPSWLVTEPLLQSWSLVLPSCRRLLCRFPSSPSVRSLCLQAEFSGPPGPPTSDSSVLVLSPPPQSADVYSVYIPACLLVFSLGGELLFGSLTVGLVFTWTFPASFSYFVLLCQLLSPAPARLSKVTFCWFHSLFAFCPDSGFELCQRLCWDFVVVLRSSWLRDVLNVLLSSWVTIRRFNIQQGFRHQLSSVLTACTDLLWTLYKVSPALWRTSSTPSASGHRASASHSLCSEMQRSNRRDCIF